MESKSHLQTPESLEKKANELMKAATDTYNNLLSRRPLNWINERPQTKVNILQLKETFVAEITKTQNKIFTDILKAGDYSDDQIKTVMENLTAGTLDSSHLKKGRATVEDLTKLYHDIKTYTEDSITKIKTDYDQQEQSRALIDQLPLHDPNQSEQDSQLGLTARGAIQHLVKINEALNGTIIDRKDKHDELVKKLLSSAELERIVSEQKKRDNLHKQINEDANKFFETQQGTLVKQIQSAMQAQLDALKKTEQTAYTLKVKGDLVSDPTIDSPDGMVEMNSDKKTDGIPDKNVYQFKDTDYRVQKNSGKYFMALPWWTSAYPYFLSNSAKDKIERGIQHMLDMKKADGDDTVNINVAFGQEHNRALEKFIWREAVMRGFKNINGYNPSPNDLIWREKIENERALLGQATDKSDFVTGYINTIESINKSIKDPNYENISPPFSTPMESKKALNDYESINTHIEQLKALFVQLNHRISLITDDATKKTLLDKYESLEKEYLEPAEEKQLEIKQNIQKVLQNAQEAIKAIPESKENKQLIENWKAVEKQAEQLDTKVKTLDIPSRSIPAMPRA